MWVAALQMHLSKHKQSALQRVQTVAPPFLFEHARSGAKAMAPVAQLTCDPVRRSRFAACR